MAEQSEQPTATTMEPMSSCSSSALPQLPHTTQPSSASCPSGRSGRSSRSSATVVAQKLAAQAEHARRVAELERAVLEKERVAADLELQAELAAIDAHSGSSSRYSRTADWVASCNNDPNLQVPMLVNDDDKEYVRKPSVSVPLAVLFPGAATTDAPSSSVAFPTPHQGQPSLIEATKSVAAPATVRPEPPAPAGPAPAKPLRQPQALPTRHAHYLGLGTHTQRDLCNNFNKVAISQDTPTDIQQLAEAITSLAASKQQSPRVSDLKLPLFDGRIQDWLLFKRTFDLTKAGFSPLENQARLNFALRGVARDEVGALLASARDPDVVMSALEARFGRPEHIVLNEIAQVKALPRLSSIDGGREMCQFACRVRRCVETIRVLNQAEYLASPELCNTIVSKLSALLRARWADFAFSRCHTKCRLELLADFLSHENEIHSKFGFIPDMKLSLSDRPVREQLYAACTDDIDNEESSYMTNDYSSAKNSLSKKQTTKPAPSNLVGEKQLPCKFCQKSNHELVGCKEFQVLHVDDRWQWVIENKFCRKCLRKGSHLYKLCKAKCDIPTCSRSFSHHTLLHSPIAPEHNNLISLEANVDIVPEHSKNNDVAHDSSSDDVEVVAHTTSQQHVDGAGRRPLLKVIPVSVSGPLGSADIYALLDDGSTATIIDSKVAEDIGAVGPKGNITVNCIGGLSKSSEVTFVNINIKGKHGQKSFDISNVRAMPKLNLTNCQSVSADDISRFDYLRDLTEELCYEQAKPALIIGVDNWHLSVPLAVRHGSRCQPVATRTPLGWVLYGFSSSKTKPVEFVNHCNFDESESVETLIKENYKLDSIGIEKKDYRTKSQARALDILENTTRRLPGGRFETGLLWRDDLKDVPNNFEIALSRFKSLERKFQKEPEFAEAYRLNMQATIDKGYAEICTKPPSGITWYLPHFGVFHPQKRKLRIVHDAAAKFLGISFNSMLLSGPDLLQNLVAILMRFREGCVALNADIREMFPQIKIRENDRDAQRFLWRSDSSSPIEVYRMSSMIFGATSSPCTALYLKNKNALDHQHLYPDAAQAIVNNHYMDDYLGSLDDVDGAARLAADIVKVHSLAGFEMRSWVSNKPEALSLLPPELCNLTTPQVGLGPSSSSSSVSSSSDCIRILGLSWNIVEDNLYFRIDVPEEIPSPLTKRAALSLLMRVYDPLGFLAPIVVQGRIMFQDLWRKGVSWDESTSASIVASWSSWLQRLVEVKTCSIPRWYQAFHHHQKPDLELHVFADASEYAYACVAYWRLSLGNDSVQLTLIGGKARLAPLKPVSMPRLELQAALIAARFASFIIQAHKHKPCRVTFWSDSMTVLRWLRSDARTFKPFVAHRVGEITEISDVSNWRYVPSSDNVADDATRPSTSKFDTSARWFTGPSFLLEPSCHWPCEPSSEVPLSRDDEVKRSATSEIVGQINVQPHELPSPVVADHSRFSEWLRLVRSTARVQQFINLVRLRLNLRRQNSKLTLKKELSRTKNFHPLSAELIEEAEKRLLLKSQIDSFPDELIQPGHLSPHSRLKHLDIRRSSDSLLRLVGRILRAQDVDTEPNPIILDGKHHIVQLMIMHFHKRAAHANNETVVNQLRREYFILHLRPSVKKAASSCLYCRIRKAQPLIPLTGDLPEARLAHHQRPFSNVGLDYFGPVSVSIGRRTEKRYVALFTCLTVRAVHLEIVASLTTDSAIMALRRFIARRGTPSLIYSDNGTAFVGTNNKLTEIYDFAASNKIVWKFIPPITPSMGGAWERLVRSVKTALSVTLKERSPREETLHTLLLEAEALVNSRPLTHVPVAPHEDQALTPFHFLIGTATNEPVLRPVSDTDLWGRTQWKKGLRLADHFWKRWVDEYLPTLVPRRSIPPQPKVQLKVGDLVLIGDGALPRGTWPRGRVTAVWPGSRGVVRCADVATKGGTLRRPVRKLVLLPTVA
ncbi:uncharacterized protein LOC135071381 [Ostrinia nubilalis]|uniref:uncharacterized protein LOC135071381 n=1 Tax=Ostrinia nubilalis TaxID=29057 RepID=UPI0030822BC4